MNKKEEVKEALDESGGAMPLVEPPEKEEEITEIKTNEGQEKYLKSLIDIFNLKQQMWAQAQKEVFESAEAIRDFSTMVVASGHEGSWFALDPKKVLHRDHEEVKNLPDYCWPKQ